MKNFLKIAATTVLAGFILLGNNCSKKKKSTDSEPPPQTIYTLKVEAESCVWAMPDTGTYLFDRIDTVDYYYSPKDGVTDVEVTLDGDPVPDSGSIIMDKDHFLKVTCDDKLIWKCELPTEVYYCCPAIGDDGTIYVSTGVNSGTGDATPFGRIHAVDPNGTVKWSFDLDYNAYSPAIGPDGTIYVQDFHNVTYAFSPAGALKWKFNDFDYPLHPIYDVGQRIPAVGADGTVYIPADGLYAVNPTTGERIWRFNPLWGKSCRQSPVIAADGTILIFIHQHDFYAVNPDGTEKWHVQLDHEEEMSFTCPAIDYDGTIYLGAERHEDSWVYAFNPDGTKKWKYPVEGSSRIVRASPTIGPDGTIYIATKAGGTDYTAKLIALTPSGTKKWEWVVESEHGPGSFDDVYSTPTIGADGMIYIGAETERLYAVNPDGTLNWKTRLESGINWSSAAIKNDGTLYIGTHCRESDHHGNLWALKTTSLGYAASPWPRFRQNNKNTGRFGGP